MNELKLIIITLIFFTGCSTKNVNRIKESINQFELDIALFGPDNQLKERWFLTEKELLYFNDCKMVYRQKVNETAEISQTLLSVDSLKLMNNYGCRGDISIQGENSVQIIGYISKHNIQSHFNFKIYNCFMDEKIGILINKLNEKIKSSNISKIEDVQLKSGGCKCENFKFGKIYK